MESIVKLVGELNTKIINKNKESVKKSSAKIYYEAIELGEKLEKVIINIFLKISSEEKKSIYLMSLNYQRINVKQALNMLRYSCISA